MPRIILPNETDKSGEPKEIKVVGEWPSYDAVLEAHGYDPASTDFEVDDPDADLENAIQNASNLQELKSALMDSNHPAKSRGRR